MTKYLFQRSSVVSYEHVTKRVANMKNSIYRRDNPGDNPSSRIK